MKGSDMALYRDITLAEILRAFHHLQVVEDGQVVDELTCFKVDDDGSHTRVGLRDSYYTLQNDSEVVLKGGDTAIVNERFYFRY